MKSIRRSFLAVAVVASGGSAVAQQLEFSAEPPAGLPAFPAEVAANLTPAAFSLGQRLFHDPVLSRDRTVSCATCHLPDFGFAHPDPFPAGIDGRRGTLHAPALFNRAWGTAMRWDGRTPSLEEFVLQPIESVDEMDAKVDQVVRRLADDTDYDAEFRASLGGAPTRERLARALSAFVNGITLGDSPVDRFQAGERDAMTVAERAGMWLWESKGGCWKCHPRPFYTDEKFHNTGVGVRAGAPEIGRLAVTGDAADRGSFKTPTLRGVALHPPYMHDGSLATLEEVVAFYRRGGNDNPQRSRLLQPLELSDEEAENLVAFLRALSRRHGELVLVPGDGAETPSPGKVR